MGFLWFGKKKKKNEVKVSVLEFGDKLEVKPIEKNEASVEKKEEVKEAAPIVEEKVKAEDAPLTQEKFDEKPMAQDTEDTKVETPAHEVKEPEKKEANTPAKTKAALKKAEPTEEKKPAAKKTAPKAAKKSEKPVTKMTEAKEEKPVEAPEVSNDAEDGETVTEGKSVASGKFDIKKAKDGRYVFNLYAANKVLIATSQIYASSQSAMTGVKSVMANAQNAPIEDSTLKNPTVYPFPKWEVYMDKAGEFRFRLYATNGNCICHAKKGYSTKSNCKRAIESIVRFVSEVNIDKSYLVK